MDRVFIEGLEIQALVGVYDAERLSRQPLRFDLELALDQRNAAASDDIADALDYAKVCERLRALVEASEFRLVEALAEACCAMLLREFPAQRVRLKLAKGGVLPNVARVGVEIERQRAEIGRERAA